MKTGLLAGNSYRFRVKARNAVGQSSYSPIFMIVAATVPSKPNAPTTTLSGYWPSELIVIDWTLPSDLGGLAILSYKIEVRTLT